MVAARKTINIGHHCTTVYRNVEIADILAQLSGRTTKRVQRPAIAPATLGPIVGGGEDAITADALYPRLILITGEGSHQMTVQEISQFGRRGLRPIVFALNNSGYLSERLLCKDMALGYNDIAAWNYAELPHALGLSGVVHRACEQPRRAR